jgi:hypothetical protein
MLAPHATKSAKLSEIGGSAEFGADKVEFFGCNSELGCCMFCDFHVRDVRFCAAKLGNTIEAQAKASK